MVLVPMELTADNGAKGALSGEFAEDIELSCQECGGSDSDCEECDGEGSVTQKVPVSWTTIKRIHRRMIELFAAPATHPTLNEAFDQVGAAMMREVCGEGVAPAGIPDDQLDGEYAAPAAQVAVSGWSAEDACEQFIAAEVDAAPEALRRLGDWLCNVLDEDQQKTASAMVLGAMMETSAAIRAASAAAPAVVVDEAMVERACRAVKYWCNGWDDLKEIGRESFKAEMRKALTAALGREGGGNG